MCNSCQMMSNLHEIIPGANNWAHLSRNLSEQFEARFVMVEAQNSWHSCEWQENGAWLRKFQNARKWVG